MDFHTAVGFCAAEKVTSDVKTVVVSTASPMKFAKEMKKETGIVVDNSHMLKHLRMKEKRVVHSSSDYGEIKKIITASLLAHN